MTIFWIAAIAGVLVGAVYVTLAVQSFARVRRDVLDTAGADRDELDVTGLDGEHGVFVWKALGAVIGSTLVIVLLGVNALFWYLPAVLAIGSSVAVVAAFLTDRRRVA